MLRVGNETSLGHIGRARMKRLIGVLVALALGGCSLLSLAPALDSNAIDYHQVVEDVTNNMLVTNILRARDHAPLHYSDLSIVRGSVQAAAAIQASLPFGPLHGTNVRDSLQLGNVSIQSTPSFDLGTLDTADFTKGILTPISGDIIKYFLDQGLNRHLVFLLFFEGIKGYSGDIKIHGEIVHVSPGDKIVNSPDRVKDFHTYLAIANEESQGLYGNSYQELRMVGKEFHLNMAAAYKEIAGLDPHKVRLYSDAKTGKFALYAVSPDQKSVLCRYLRTESIGGDINANEHRGLTSDRFKVFGLSQTRLPLHRPSAVCTDPEVIVDSASAASDIVLFPRSPQGILEYLGALLRLQERERRTITLSPDPATGHLFSLSNQPEGARFSVKYRGATYYVNSESERDHSLAVLGLLNQLFNLYKSSKDIPTTRTVNIAP